LKFEEKEGITVSEIRSSLKEFGLSDISEEEF
jgi:hypothetical protein